MKDRDDDREPEDDWKRATKRPPERQVFNVGSLGVNRVVSPIHLVDGALLHAQNVAFSREADHHGLMKRAGMARYNGLAAAGSILSFHDIAYPDLAPLPPGYLYFQHNYDALGNTCARTSDGSGFTPGSWLGDNYTAVGLGTCAMFDAKMYYPAVIFPELTDAGKFAEWDGTTEVYPIFTVPSITMGGNVYTPGGVVSMDSDGTYLYALAHYWGVAGTIYAVQRVTFGTWAISQLGQTFFDGTAGTLDGDLFHVRCWNGAVWVAGVNGSPWAAAKVWWVPIAGGTWTEDLSFGGTGPGDHQAPPIPLGGGDVLWLSSGNPGTLRVRTGGGAWATVDTGVPDQSFEPVYAAGQTCYVWKYSPDTALLRYTTNAGGAFSTIATLAEDLIPVCRGLLWQGGIYAVRAPLLRSTVYRVTPAGIADLYDIDLYGEGVNRAGGILGYVG